MTSEDLRLHDEWAAWLAPLGAAPLGLAVSGGGDSMAMLHLAAGYAREAGMPLRAVTVDHGLRAEAAQEAAFVAETCAQLSVPHDTLRWDGAEATGNLPDQARRARYRLIADWARQHGIATVALAHTEDDQAETVLMRLARGAGVDGLSGMQPRRDDGGVVWLRPLLEVSRAELRAYLTRQGQGWCEDPSNQDRRFDRIKARDALQQLAPLGITALTLATVAANMSSARAALEVQTLQAAREICTVDRGDVVIDRAGLAQLPSEISRRLVQHALIWISSADYGPRAPALEAFIAALLASETATLHGCLARPEGANLRLLREVKAVAGTRSAPDELWDGRWRITGAPKGAEMRALTQAGLRQCPDWRETGLPRQSLLASPSVWNGEYLVAAPLAGLQNECHAELAQGDDSFYSVIISH